MRQKLMVAALVLITAAYCWGLGWIAWGFSRAGGTIGWGLALGGGILLALTAWVTWRQELFGLAAGRLPHEYRPEPGDQGQIEADPSAAGAEPRAKEPVRAAAGHDAPRDRRDGRGPARRAIEVGREGPDPGEGAAEARPGPGCSAAGPAPPRPRRLSPGEGPEARRHRRSTDHHHQEGRP